MKTFLLLCLLAGMAMAQRGGEEMPLLGEVCEVVGVHLDPHGPPNFMQLGQCFSNTLKVLNGPIEKMRPLLELANAVTHYPMGHLVEHLEYLKDIYAPAPTKEEIIESLNFTLESGGFLPSDRCGMVVANIEGPKRTHSASVCRRHFNIDAARYVCHSVGMPTENPVFATAGEIAREIADEFGNEWGFTAEYVEYLLEGFVPPPAEDIKVDDGEAHLIRDDCPMSNIVGVCCITSFKEAVSVQLEYMYGGSDMADSAALPGVNAVGASFNYDGDDGSGSGSP